MKDVVHGDLALISLLVDSRSKVSGFSFFGLIGTEVNDDGLIKLMSFRVIPPRVSSDGLVRGGGGELNPDFQLHEIITVSSTSEKEVQFIFVLFRWPSLDIDSPGWNLENGSLGEIRELLGIDSLIWDSLACR